MSRSIGPHAAVLQSRGGPHASKPRRRVVLAWGQSVELGQVGGAGNVAGPLKSYIPVARTDILAYRDTTITGDELQTWHAMRFRQPTAGWNWAGCDTIYMPTLGAGSALIEVAKGATTTYIDWNPSDPGAMYTRLISSATAAINSYPLPVRWEPIIYANIGQSDAKTTAHANAFGTNFTGIIAGIRANVPHFATAPVVVDYLHEDLGIAGATPETIAAINNAIAAFVAADPFGAIALNTSDLAQHVDDTHWIESDYVTHGPRVATAILDLIG